MRNRRRTWGLNWGEKPQQHFIFLEFILMVLTLIYLLYLIFGTMDHAVKQISSPDQADWNVVFEQISFSLLFRISALFAVVFVVHIFCGLFFLHRLTGPMIRTRNMLTQIADGEIPQADVMLRKGDFPTDLAYELSRALRRIRSYQKK